MVLVLYFNFCDGDRGLIEELRKNYGSKMVILMSKCLMFYIVNVLILKNDFGRIGRLKCLWNI